MACCAEDATDPLVSSEILPIHSRRRMNISSRPSWDETFRDLTLVWARRSTCSRRQVGAIIVKNKMVVGQGYNGVASGKTHCIDGGCPRGQLGYDEVPAGADYNQYPCHALHAEFNAAIGAGLDACNGAILYVNAEPCTQCSALIERFGIEKVVIV